MKFRAAILSALVVAGVVAVPATAEAKGRPDVVWQYRCPGNGKPPTLASGVIQPCKHPQQAPKLYRRVIH